MSTYLIGKLFNNVTEWKIGYFSYGQNKSPNNLVFNDELFHVHAY